MKNKVQIICTLGPSTINKKFLEFSTKNIDLLRLNMSHLSVLDLKKNIRFIQRHTSTPICIDTEGAQIRTKVLKSKLFKLGNKIKIQKYFSNFKLYPEKIFHQLKKGDILNIGFDNLRVKIVSKSINIINCKVISPGKLENNKGVHLENRKIKLDYLTAKDRQAIEVGKKFKIKYYALSFSNSVTDIKNFNKLLKNKKKIFKIETINAVKDFKNMIKVGDMFLIDRGDLSKETKIEYIPLIQRELFKIKKKYQNKKKIFVATNLLESMIVNYSPTRGEANDIYSSIEMGASGLVLAAETAIGSHPINSVNFLKKIIKIFYKK